MLNKALKRNKGITLIALVVTIIVLLILAGISINALAGHNGILNRAIEAKESTGIAQTEEAIKVAIMEAATKGLGTITDANLKEALNSAGISNDKISGDETNGWTVKTDGKDYKISSTGKMEGSTSGGDQKTLPSVAGSTIPYYPNSTFSYKEGDLESGLVIEDSSHNEYVWVEVPKTIYDDETYNGSNANKPSGNTDYGNIEKCLKEYTKDYKYSNYSDTNSSFTTLYENMLESVYENGGFWIGRYEAGLEEGKALRIQYVELSESDKAVIKPNMIPYNYVTRDEAQTLATRMNYANCTSSLIFGVQWDLTLKYIETKKVTTVPYIKTKLTLDSTEIGNYRNSELMLTRGKFTRYDELLDWKDFNNEDKTGLVIGRKKIAQNYYKNAIILTTGAAQETNLQNIYDIAGNMLEWTLEYYKDNKPCVCRGGSSFGYGSDLPAKSRSDTSTIRSNMSIGFRVGLWK